MNTKRLFAIFSSILLLVCCGVMLIACAPNDPAPNSSKFTFTGEATISGTDYDVELKGLVGTDQNKGDFELWVSSIPVPLEGEYEFVAKKGYIFSFADANDTVIKTHYDSSTKKFYFDYYLNIGSSNGGIGRVRLYMEDAAFASAHDGEDWGWDMLWFKATNDVLIPGNNCTLLITCAADGTFTTVPTSSMIAVPARKGTWTFDATANAYTFVCDDNYEAQTYTSTYDADKKEYSISMHFNIGMAVPISADYAA